MKWVSSYPWLLAKSQCSCLVLLFLMTGPFLQNNHHPIMCSRELCFQHTKVLNSECMRHFFFHFFISFYSTDRCSLNLCCEWLCLSGRWSVCRALESEIGKWEQSPDIDSCSHFLWYDRNWVSQDKRKKKKRKEKVKTVRPLHVCSSSCGTANQSRVHLISLCQRFSC